MTEAALTRTILSFIREARPDLPLVWKVNDRMTAGIPDVIVVTGTTSWWWEFKKASTGTQRVEKMLTPKQHRLLTRLHKGGVNVGVIVKRPSGMIEYYFVTDLDHPVMGASSPRLFAQELLGLLA